MRKTSVALIAAAAAVAACAQPKLDDYAGGTPRLDLRTYLDGALTASGVFFGRGGRADLRFVAEMTGAWNGDVGTLSERFVYDDGRTDERVWTIAYTDEDSFTATAHDVVGQAVGAQSGNAARMTYRLLVPRGDDEVEVSMEDWFYLLEDGTLINRARMSKFGFTVGELVVAFRKASE